MNLITKLPVAFIWHVQYKRAGRLLGEETIRNLIPTEGLNHILSIVLKGGTQQASWFVALFEGNYTPVLGDTAANFAANATECTSYDSATRPAWTGGSVAAGAVSNVDSKAAFVMSAAKTVYGAALLSSSTKGGTTGVLLSNARFSTAKVLEIDDTLDVAVGITLVNP